MISITLFDKYNAPLAHAEGSAEALLCTDRAYAEGDLLEITGPRHLFLQADHALPWGEVFLPGGKMTWRVPFGEHRLAYPPGCFEAPRHIVSIREMSREEILSVRPLSRNPADLRGDTDFYPHCTANVETRNEACFCARNVVDGLTFNTFHGEWPYQSWGIGAREDAWCMLDLGRETAVTEMALVLRADFPHDAWWTGGYAVLSDGAEIAFTLKKTGDRQFVPLAGHRVRWLRLERLSKSDDPSAFPALRQWEVFGRDIE
ncbi:MAG: carbohydrate-binding protein [Clostridia bacterium]|nr:carbohydrate-binding protein [Clostridia bacterium]